MTDFQSKVFEVVKQIPKGSTLSYKEVARIIGMPDATRAIGNALNKSPGMPELPCHRVIKSNGEIGGFKDGTEKKKALLTKEGVEIVEGKVRS